MSNYFLPKLCWVALSLLEARTHITYTRPMMMQKGISSSTAVCGTANRLGGIVRVFK